MAGRRTNLALLAMLAGAFASGGLAFAVGTGWNRWVTIAHGIVGVAVVVLTPWKALVIRSGLRRRTLWRALPSLLLVMAVLVALLFGFVHAAGLRTLGPITAMQLHVAAALVALPLVIGHLVTHPQRPRRTDLSRRSVLRAGAVAGGAALAYGAGQTVAADRRFTGSIETGTDRPAAMPVTQWLDDTVPSIDAERWMVAVAGRRWHYDELAGFDDNVRAVLDCTGGWWAEQDWEGVRLDRLLGDTGSARSIVVRSATGYTRRFPVGDAEKLLLASRLAGAPLSAGHGHPARLVAPGRRGFWWVKWVVAVELSDRPWWWQSPFPLT
ncbi:hypothetical protein BH24ACT3_BH24ACT3_09810 [soil metagenome]